MCILAMDELLRELLQLKRSIDGVARSCIIAKAHDLDEAELSVCRGYKS